ncbi:Bro-N domain-containing protein [Timonella senegalensis]|uniref:BRO-N domain-containing protein n=1 Tax=Timonella senegalensis TaxID=1465825 RepID=UPI002FDDE6ED
MTSLQPFIYGTQEVRTILIDNEPWFVLNDLCAILNITNVGNVLARLDPEDKSSIRLTDGTPGNPNRAIVSEAGMFDVIVRSDSPNARPFQRWVTHEVLPQIRKTGAYGAPTMDLTTLDGISAILDAGKAALNRALAAEARAEVAESTVDQIEASNGITPTQFHKHYFSDVPDRQFFEHLYRLGLLIDQRGTRVNARGETRDGYQHGHPSYKGKPYFYLHGRLDANGVRRESTRVRPGTPEIALKDFLVSKGLPANQNKTTLFKEIAA